MPAVSLPDDLIEQLEQSGSGQIDNTEGPGVAVYWTSDRRTRVDIYIGFQLDGFTLYQNISSVQPNIKMQFALKPDVLCPSDVLTFKANQDSVIAIKVKYRLNIYWYLLHIIIIIIMRFFPAEWIIRAYSGTHQGCLLHL